VRIVGECAAVSIGIGTDTECSHANAALSS
jgi:hypothetical protein